MSRAISYDLAGRHFATQSELEKTVTEYLASIPRDTEFQCPFLREIVNSLHPQVIAAGQRSDGRFKVLSWKEQVNQGLPYAEMYRGGQVVMTFFEPLGEWRDVTLKPWRKGRKESELSGALRAKASGFIPKPIWGERCAHPGCMARGFALRYHHVTPTFDKMVAECLDLMTPEERETLFGYDKFKPGILCVADCIPNDHPAVVRLGELHQANEWVWLCDAHHVEFHRAAA